MKRHFLFICLVALVFTTFLSGCSRKPVSSDIVGVWVEQHTDGSDSSQCGSIEFLADGRFNAKNVPSKSLVSEDYSPERMSASGTWKLDTSSTDPFAVHEVKLRLDPLESFPLGFETALYIAIGGGQLFSGVDEGHQVFFEKGKPCK